MYTVDKSWQEKLSELRDYLERKGYDAMVVTALDEIGWLFNLVSTNKLLSLEGKRKVDI